MNQQLAITFPAAYLGERAWERQLEALQAAVTHLGPKDVAWELKIDGPRLSDALKDRNQKVWHPHWTHVVKAMLASRPSDEVAGKLLRTIVDIDVECTPYGLTSESPLTQAEESAALAAIRKARAR